MVKPNQRHHSWMNLPFKTIELRGGCLLCCLLIGFFTACQNKERKPNIIYIYADDLGYGELGVYGQEKIKTPHLDQLAQEGIRFTHHYTSAPVCAPARCMLMTGRHSGHSFIRGNYELGGFADDQEGGQMPLPENALTVAKVLQQAGYKTGIIGKWGLGVTGTSGHPNRQGFDYFYGYLDQKQAHNYYPTHLWENEQWDTLQNPSIVVHRKIEGDLTDEVFDYYKSQDYAIDKMREKTKAFIERHKDEPFFLYLPSTIPHVSLQVPDGELEPYLGKFDEQPYGSEKGYAATKYPLSTYAAMISYLDKQVGEVVAYIKELGLEENTVIMFSSDNGPTFNGGVDREYFNSTGGLRGGKGEVYEGGIRVPFIARWPGKITSGQVSDVVSVQYDMMATLCDIAGVEAPPNDGISLWPALSGQGKVTPRDYLYFEFPERGGQVAIRFQKYKGVKTGLKNNPNSPWQLYDLESDTKEEYDIAAQHPDILQKMDSIVKSEHWSATIREWEIIDPKFNL